MEELKRRISIVFLITNRVHTFSSIDFLSCLSHDSAPEAKLLAITKCVLWWEAKSISLFKSHSSGLPTLALLPHFTLMITPDCYRFCKPQAY